MSFVPTLDRRPLWLGLAAIAVTTMLALAPTPPRDRAGAPLAERLLHFDDGADGSVVVRGADEGTIARFPVAEGGFLRGTLRALARERRQEGEGSEAPFRVAQWPDGQLTLEDMATGRRIDVTAFGATQAALFRRLLTEKGQEP